MLSWPFLIRRLSAWTDLPGALEPELKASLSQRPLSAICSNDDTLPRPIQVGARSLLLNLPWVLGWIGQSPGGSQTCWGEPSRAAPSCCLPLAAEFPRCHARGRIAGGLQPRNELHLARSSSAPSQSPELAELRTQEMCRLCHNSLQTRKPKPSQAYGVNGTGRETQSHCEMCQSGRG